MPLQCCSAAVHRCHHNLQGDSDGWTGCAVHTVQGVQCSTVLGACAVQYRVCSTSVQELATVAVGSYKNGSVGETVK